MKLLIIPIAIIMLIALFFIGKTNMNTGSFFSRHATKLFDYNTVSIESFVSNIDPKNLTITQKNKGIIYKNGTELEKIRNFYGTNCFVISEEESVLAEICFFKKNYWHINNFMFSVLPFEDDIFITLNIVGPDSISNISIKKFSSFNKKTEVRYFDKNKNLYHIDTIPKKY
jgi:hypothetical protein